MSIFKPEDFKSIYKLDQYGDEAFVGSTSLKERIALSITADKALKKVIGLEKRVSREEWDKLYVEYQKWGEAYSKEVEEDGN